ncbi:hypothetical protein MBLNU459_g4347t1 [Dothideomycetes sp. NU459]
MSVYEARRLERIKRNEKLIDELGIARVKQELPVKRPPSKKRKVSTGPPARVSARIASSTTRPSYVDESPIQSLASSRATSTKIVKKRQRDSTANVPDRSASPPQDIDDIRAGWTSWQPIAPAPSRDEDGTFHFDSYPSFQPNKSPAEMLAEGAFGGSYYRPLYSKTLRITIEDDWKELPEDWVNLLNIDKYLTNPVYDPDVNKFRVKCGQSIEEWEASGWIAHAYDVRGWFQWYTRFWMGRRCEDDARQIGRWERCVGKKGRWRRTLIKKYLQAGVKTVADEGADEEDVSPVIHQTCHQWAWEVRQQSLDDAWAGIV